ncbi:DUF6882 domain-containing protein [Gymnodinialimonas hymeniacidonis]|uniref:DUF6882 domain-containing protein n=1 Tax=Gymnodinialimonas hymeniacidonis TaxID=3126508 RepID=UPI0034C682A1
MKLVTAFLLSGALAGSAAADSELTAASAAASQNGWRTWHAEHGLGSFDMTGLSETNVIVHNPDNGPRSQWSVELVGARDSSTNTCSWAWALDDLSHLPRTSAQAVFTHAENTGAAALSQPAHILDYHDCADWLGHAIVLGDPQVIIPLSYGSERVHYFGFISQIAGSS